MAEYKSKNAGLLQVTDVKEGDKIIMMEGAYETFSEAKQKSYWNCRVELPNKQIKLAGLMDNVCEMFASKWGTNTDEWAGRTLIVNIKIAKSGNPYLSYTPTDEARIEVPKKEEVKTIEYPSADSDAVRPEDIPF